MLWWIIIVLPLLFHLPEELESVVLEIEGHIDLGPKWIFGQDRKKLHSRTETSEIPNIELRAYTGSSDEESPEEVTKLRHLKKRVTTDVFKSKQFNLRDWPFEPKDWPPKPKDWPPKPKDWPPKPKDWLPNPKDWPYKPKDWLPNPKDWPHKPKDWPLKPKDGPFKPEWFSTKKRKKYKKNPFSDHVVNITQKGANKVLIITMHDDNKAKNHTKEKKKRKRQKKKRKKDINMVRSLNDTPIQIETNHNSIIFFRDNTSNSTEPTSPTTVTEERVTHLYEKTIKSNIFENPHQVKEDERLQDFIVHVYKQSLRALNAIKSKVNNTNVTKKVDFITERYKEKFKEFVNETKNLMISTKLGTQKVILNIIDTSNRILSRLVNYLAGEIEKKLSLRDTSGVTKVLDKEVDNEVKSEYIHVCLRFGICRSSHGFMDFLTNFFSEIERNDDRKLRIFTDAFIDVFENEEFHKVIDEKLKRDVVATNKKLEKMDSGELRVGVTLLRNMVASRNMPLSVSEGASSELVERSVALMDVLDALEQKIKPSENNKRIWNDITQSLKDWREAKRDDIGIILQTLLTLIKNAVNRFDSKAAYSVREKLTILFRNKDIDE